MVLLSAVSHAAWNLLLKRASNQEVFVWALLLIGSVLLFPLGIVLLWNYPATTTGLAFVAASSLTHVFYFILLGRGYAKDDLSLVYPVARGTGSMLIPILAVLILGESVGSQAVIGIAMIIGGIFIVSWWGRFKEILSNPSFLLRDGGIRYAALTGLTIAIYGLIDKQGVEHIQPFLYMYFLTVGSAIGSAPYILLRHGMPALKDEWTSNGRGMVAAGLLVFLAYGLVLTAFSLSRVSYVAPAREVGVVVGVLMGVFFLKERFGRGRILGSSIIVLGLILIATSP